MVAERRYLWDEKLNIYFEDGRFLYQVHALGEVAAHWCDPDRYDASYDFTDWPKWSCTWRVRGAAQGLYTAQPLLKNVSLEC